MNPAFGRTFLLALPLFLPLASIVGGCGGAQALQGKAPEAPSFEAAGQAKCSVKKSQSRPLVVEWPLADRVALESQAKQGVVVVRYEGCEMEVLRRCTAPGAYSYVGVTPQDERVVIRTTDELYAAMPIFAAKFESKLESKGQLDVSLSMVGSYDAPRATLLSSDLKGACEGATHVITSLTAGAFEFGAGASAGASANVSALGAGAGGGTTSSRESLSHAGEPAVCKQAKSDDKAPPFGCGALLRIEVTALGAAARPAATAKVPKIAAPVVVAPHLQWTPSPRLIAMDPRLDGGGRLVSGQLTDRIAKLESELDAPSPDGVEELADAYGKLAWVAERSSTRGYPWENEWTLKGADRADSLELSKVALAASRRASALYDLLRDHFPAFARRERAGYFAALEHLRQGLPDESARVSQGETAFAAMSLEWEATRASFESFGGGFAEKKMRGTGDIRTMQTALRRLDVMSAHPGYKGVTQEFACFVKATRTRLTFGIHQGRNEGIWGPMALDAAACASKLALYEASAVAEYVGRYEALQGKATSFEALRRAHPDWGDGSLAKAALGVLGSTKKADAQASFLRQMLTSDSKSAQEAACERLRADKAPDSAATSLKTKYCSK
ncbi:MAG: hypothetical protein U0174_07440 [Polyangiaceae bacterium]